MLVAGDHAALLAAVTPDNKQSLIRSVMVVMPRDCLRTHCFT